MSTDTLNSNRKIEEALHLLNEAAKEKKDELRSLLSDKYSAVKDALTDVAANNKEILDRVQKMAWNSFEEGKEKIGETMETVDAEVRKNPWPYIGGVAAVALLLGFVMGSSRK